jgi:hypothetical protein
MFFLHGTFIFNIKTIKCALLRKLYLLSNENNPNGTFLPGLVQTDPTFAGRSWSRGDVGGVVAPHFELVYAIVRLLLDALHLGYRRSDQIQTFA